MCDGEKPTIPGDVPIQLVVIGKESYFPVRRVRQRVGILPGREDHVLISNVDPLAVGLILNMEFLRLSVARHFQYLEINDVTVAQPILIAGRKVAVDAVMDLYGCAAHADGLRYQQRGVLLHTDAAVIIKDFFACGW